MSLLGGLWGGGSTPDLTQGATESAEGCLTKKGMTFAEAVSSSSGDLAVSKGERNIMQSRPLLIKGAK